MCRRLPDGVYICELRAVLSYGLGVKGLYAYELRYPYRGFATIEFESY